MESEKSESERLLKEKLDAAKADAERLLNQKIAELQSSNDQLRQQRDSAKAELQSQLSWADNYSSNNLDPKMHGSLINIMSPHYRWVIDSDKGTVSHCFRFYILRVEPVLIESCPQDRHMTLYSPTTIITVQARPLSWRRLILKIRIQTGQYRAMPVVTTST